MFAATAAALFALAPLAGAQQVASRAALNGMFTSSTIETFELMTHAPGDAYLVSQSNLDASTNPGQIVAGIQFYSASGVFQHNSAGYYGMSSETLEAQGVPLRINFLNFTTAFGLDATDFNCCASSGTASIYDSGDNLIGSFGFTQPDAPAFDFVGFHSAGGIDHVILSGSQYWSPIVDNVQFGVANEEEVTPEPASLVLLGTGLAGIFGIARRKRSR